MRKTFENVVVSDEWGSFADAGFQLHKHVHDSLGRITFALCTIEMKKVAVFFNQRLHPVSCDQIASKKPDWLDAIAHADVVSTREPGSIVIHAPADCVDGEELARIAFAVTCVAVGEGAFDAEPESYLVRIGDRLLVQVKIELDWDSETWFGETESRATGTCD